MPRFCFFDSGVARALATALVLAAKDFPPDTERYLLSRDAIVREENDIHYMPWGEFIQRQYANAGG